MSGLQEKLRGEVILSEDELYQLSEYIEPRAGKERGPRPLALGASLEPQYIFCVIWISYIIF